MQQSNDETRKKYASPIVDVFKIAAEDVVRTSNPIEVGVAWNIAWNDIWNGWNN